MVTTRSRGTARRVEDAEPAVVAEAAPVAPRRRGRPRKLATAAPNPVSAPVAAALVVTHAATPSAPRVCVAPPPPASTKPLISRQRALQDADDEIISRVLRDFDIEVESRCQLLRTCVDNLALKMQSALTLELMKLPHNIRAMSYADYIATRGVEENDDPIAASMSFKTPPSLKRGGALFSALRKGVLGSVQRSPLRPRAGLLAESRTPRRAPPVPSTPSSRIATRHTPATSRSARLLPILHAYWGGQSREPVVKVDLADGETMDLADALARRHVSLNGDQRARVAEGLSRLAQHLSIMERRLERT